MTYWREYTVSVNTRCGNMLPETAIPGLTGFVSVYSFSEADALAIKASGVSQGFKQYKVFSKYLILDLDDGGASIEAVVARLNARSLSYTIYESGSKGSHIFIACEAECSTDLPAKHKVLALELAPSCDVSLYRHSSLIRLPGTVHEKTGKTKKIILQHKGTEILKLPELKVIETQVLPQGTRESLFLYYSTIAAALESDVAPGYRHSQLWRIVQDGYRAGLSAERVLEDCLTVNNEFPVPKSEAEVEQVVRQKYH